MTRTPFDLWLLRLAMLCFAAAFYQCVRILIDEYCDNEKPKGQKAKRPSEAHNPAGGNLRELGGASQNLSSATTCLGVKKINGFCPLFNCGKIGMKLLKPVLKCFGFIHNSCPKSDAPKSPASRPETDMMIKSANPVLRPEQGPGKDILLLRQDVKNCVKTAIHYLRVSAKHLEGSVLYFGRALHWMIVSLKAASTLLLCWLGNLHPSRQATQLSKESASYPQENTPQPTKSSGETDYKKGQQL